MCERDKDRDREREAEIDTETESMRDFRDRHIVVEIY